MRAFLSRLGLGALVVAALLMAASGALRLGHGVGAAIAETRVQSADAAHPDTAPDATMAAANPDPAHCPAPPAELARALSDRDAALKAREASVAQREAALELADQVTRQRLKALEDMEHSLSALIVQVDAAAEQDLIRLTTMYETMKPKQAAAIFDQMVPEFAAGFLGRMQPEIAAQIMAGMKPEISHAVTVLLAGRNARAPVN